MVKPTFSLTGPDPELRELITGTDRLTLAAWAIECAERVMPFFEEAHPDDSRPRRALQELQEWMDTGVFDMSVIRGASLASHAAAREVGGDSPARSAARAAGHAVATAHVSTHAYGPAIYAQQAIFRATGSLEAVAEERAWQYERLVRMSIESRGASSE